MRCMMLMYPDPKAETGAMPELGQIQQMLDYNQRLIDAGVLLGGEGLHPTLRGARVRFGGAKTTVSDGPFTENKEILGGYWMIRVETLAEAVAWARQAPCPEGEMIEIRQVFESEEFGPEIAAREEKMMRQIETGLKQS